MNIQVNGQTKEIKEGESIQGLLETLGYQDSFVAVAINSRCVPRKQFAEHRLIAKDEVEILAPMAGG